MKKRLLIITIFILAVLLISTSCAQAPSPSTNDTKYNVVFTVDGKICSTVLTAGGDLIPLPEDPEKEGFQFDGWYTNGLEGGEEVRFSATALVSLNLNGDLTVYAKWTCLHASLSDWIVDVTPTCKQGGSRHKDCLICSETVTTEQMDKLTEHTPAKPIVETLDDSDCRKPITYLETVYCSVCNKELSKTILEGDENGRHTPSDNTTVIENTVLATCTQNGSCDVVVYCAICGDEISRTHKTVPAIGHSTISVNENAVSATCTQNGSYDEVVYCSTCGDEISRTQITTEKLPHTESDWIIKSEATCKEEGSKYKNCLVCEEVLQTESIDKLTTHTYDQSNPAIENTVAASCYAEGSYDEAVYCSICGAEVSRTTKVISKTEHTPGEWIVDIAPTYDEEGSHHKECVVCGETTQTESIPKLERVYGSISYYLNGGSATEALPEVYEQGKTLTLPTTVKLSGYKFIGWYENAELTGEPIFEIPANATSDYILYAKWEISHGTLAFELNGGVATEALPDTYEYGTALVLPTAVTRFSYRFAGWYLNPEFAGSPISQISAAQKGNLTLYAKWEKAFSVLTFELGGGEMSGDSVIRLPLGGYTLPTDVTNGYLDFLGWYLEPDFQTKVTEIFGVEGEDITVYAKYREYTEPHKTFSNTTHQIIGEGCIQYGDLIAADPDKSLTLTFIPDSTDLTSVRNGYIRIRTKYLRHEVRVIWLADNDIKDSDGNVISNYADGAKIEVVMDFEARELRYYVDGEFVSVVTDVNYQSDLTHYNFEKDYQNQIYDYLWQYNAMMTDSDFTIAINVGDNYSDNIGYANLTFNSEFGGDFPTLYHPKKGLVLPIPEHFGYKFIGWYENAIFSGDPITEIPAGSTDDYTFYAKWEKVIGFITYELNGGECEGLFDTYVYDSPLVLPTNAVKYGFTFVGWYMTPDFIGAPLTEISAEQRGDITLYAKWDKAFGIIYLNLNGGKINEEFDSKIVVGQKIILPTELTKIGSVFAGWYADEALTQKITSVTSESKEDIHVYAKWYDAHWSKGTGAAVTEYYFGQEKGGWNGGDIGSDMIAAGSDSLTLRIDFATSGNREWTWGSIRMRQGLGGAQCHFAMFENGNIVTGNGKIALTAANSGDVVDFVINFSAQTVTYYVNGWQIAEEYYSTIGKDLTYYNYETSPTGAALSRGNMFQLTNNSPRTVAYDGVSIFIADIYGDATPTASNISFELNGGSAQTKLPTSYLHKDGLTLPTDVTKENYVFAGWYDNAELTGDPITQIPAGSTENYTFFAKWERLSGSITYVLNGGEAIEELPATYTYNEAQTLPTNVYKFGATFVGWFTTPDFQGDPISEISADQRGDITLYAKWKTNQPTPPGGSGIQLPFYPL